MTELIASTYQSWAEKLRNYHHLPENMSDDQIMSWVYHSFLKQPPGNIVEVKRSSLISRCGPEIQQALDELERDALSGDLDKYVSKEAKRLGGKHDGLLYRSAIWHFHILPEPGRPIHTSRLLVYAYTWRNVLYLLEIGTHRPGEFSQDRHYLEVINQEWPDVLPLEDIEIEDPPLGGGVEASRESTLITGYIGNIKHFADYADFLLDKVVDELREGLAKRGYIMPGPLHLEFIEHDRTKKKGFYPSYAFFYQVAGTPFFILCDLRDGKNEIHFLTVEECAREQAKINKRREQAIMGHGPNAR